LTTSPVTSDLIVDCIHDVWLLNEERFPLVKTLVINQDNGPECHSRRTQFMKRIAQLADETQQTLQLAYYPPYHSKYNPIERVWGVLENYWTGSLLDTLETVFHFAQNMTYNGVHPVVEIVKKTYHTGITLTRKAMDELENRFERLPGLEKYFVTISPLPNSILGRLFFRYCLTRGSRNRRTNDESDRGPAAPGVSLSSRWRYKPGNGCPGPSPDPR